MLNLVLIGVAALAVWAVVVLASPTRACARCRGARVARSWWTGRVTGCPRCHGTGRCYRIGAVLVHRGWRDLRAAARDVAAEARQRKAQRKEDQ